MSEKVKVNLPMNRKVVEKPKIDLNIKSILRKRLKEAIEALEQRKNKNNDELRVG